MSMDEIRIQVGHGGRKRRMIKREDFRKERAWEEEKEKRKNNYGNNFLHNNKLHRQ